MSTHYELFSYELRLNKSFVRNNGGSPSLLSYDRSDLISGGDSFLIGDDWVILVDDNDVDVYYPLKSIDNGSIVSLIQLNNHKKEKSGWERVVVEIRLTTRKKQQICQLCY